MNQAEDYTQDSNRESERFKRILEEGSMTIPVVEEKFQVGKETMETGKVKIHKRVTEEEVSVPGSLIQERIYVDHVPVNKYVETAPPAIRYEGDTMIIPVMQEVIEKRLILVEEIHIIKNKTTRDIPDKKVILRKEEVSIERIDDTGIREKIEDNSNSEDG